jgi:hypothetical protein
MTHAQRSRDRAAATQVQQIYHMAIKPPPLRSIADVRHSERLVAVGPGTDITTGVEGATSNAP